MLTHTVPDLNAATLRLVLCCTALLHLCYTTIGTLAAGQMCEWDDTAPCTCREGKNCDANNCFHKDFPLLAEIMKVVECWSPPALPPSYPSPPSLPPTPPPPPSPRSPPANPLADPCGYKWIGDSQYSQCQVRYLHPCCVTVPFARMLIPRTIAVRVSGLCIAKL